MAVPIDPPLQTLLPTKGGLTAAVSRRARFLTSVLCTRRPNSKSCTPTAASIREEKSWSRQAQQVEAQAYAPSTPRACFGDSSWPQPRGADHLRTTRRKANVAAGRFNPSDYLAGPFQLLRSPSRLGHQLDVTEDSFAFWLQCQSASLPLLRILAQA